MTAHSPTPNPHESHPSLTPPSAEDQEDAQFALETPSRLMEAVRASHDADFETFGDGAAPPPVIPFEPQRSILAIDAMRNKMRLAFPFLQSRAARKALKVQSHPRNAAFWSASDRLDLLDDPSAFALAVEQYGFADFLLPIEENRPEAFAYGPEGFWPELADRLGGAMAAWADRERRVFLTVQKPTTDASESSPAWPAISAPPNTDWADRAALRALGVAREGEEDDLRAQCLLSLKQRDNALTILAMLVAKGCPLSVLRALWGEETLDMALMEALARGCHDQLGFDGVKTLQIAVRSRVFPAELGLPAVIMRKQFERLLGEQERKRDAVVASAVEPVQSGTAASAPLDAPSQSPAALALAQKEAARAKNIREWVAQLQQRPPGMEVLGPNQKPAEASSVDSIESLAPEAQKKLDELAEKTGALPPSEALERALAGGQEKTPIGPNLDAFRSGQHQPRSGHGLSATDE